MASKSSLTAKLPAILGLGLVLAVIAVFAVTSKAGKTGAPDKSGILSVVAAESFWGDIAAQLGGDRVSVVSIIDNPATDPHEFEPTAAHSRAVAEADYVLINGIDYDPWADKLLAASQNPAPVLNVGSLVGLEPGANPHQWYSPDVVKQVVARITSDYKKLQPANAAYFNQRKTTYETVELKQYNALIKEIKTSYAGLPVGASESVFEPLAKSLGLNLVTPPSFLAAMSEGTDPTVADKATVNQQITGKQIKMYVYNAQNSTPDVARQVEQARTAGIPVVTLTETPPAGTSFAEWQTRQLQSLRHALAQAMGR